MPLLPLPLRRPASAGVALTALLVASVAGALPAAGADRPVPAPAAVLDVLSPLADTAEELPRGVTLRAPAGTSRLRSLSTPAPAPARARLTASRVSTINVTFVDTPGYVWSDQAKRAFRAAADIWERTVESRVPIEVEATAQGLGAGVLGGAEPGLYIRNEGATPASSQAPVTDQEKAAYADALRDDVLEPVALHNARTGRDAVPPGDPDPDSSPYDVLAAFNPNLAGLYLGTDGAPPSNQIDFRTIVLHEIGHGLGIVGSASVQSDRATIGYRSINGSTGVRTGLSFDQFTYTTDPELAGSGGTRVLALADGSLALREALTGGSLYWAGQQTLTAARGRKVRLYAPTDCGDPGPARPCEAGESPFVEGTSYSHLDESVYDRGTANGLMTPYLEPGESYTDPGQLAMGLLADMGYAVPALQGSRYTAVAPTRVLDTRKGQGADRPLGAGESLDLRVAGVGSVPADATAVVLNVTGVSPTERTDLRVYPTPVTLTPVPGVSNLNLAPGVTRANLVTVPVGADGRVRIRNTAGRTAVLADLAGWYAPAADASFTAVDPQRVLDTRRGLGAPSATPVGGDEYVDLRVAGVAGVPTDASAVALTVTAVGASRETDVRVYPTPSDTPTVPIVSNLNVRAGAAVPNVVIAKVGDGGTVRLRNQVGTVHLLADVAGWYDTESAGSLFRAVAPQRLLDTRVRLGIPADAPTRVGPGQSVTLAVGGRAGLPRAATAAVLNVTGVAASDVTDVRVFPATAATTPTVSNLNLAPGETAADLVMVKLGGGQVRLRNTNGSVALLADAAGWFGPGV